MWLLGRLNPDFKTIADFRKNNEKDTQKYVVSSPRFVARYLGQIASADRRGDIAATNKIERLELKMKSLAMKSKS